MIWWGDPRVDVWYYAMLGVAGASCVLFFTRSKWAIPLYLCLPITILIRQRYEQAIFDHLLDGIPIRVDYPIVVLVAVFPLLPIIVHVVRTVRGRKKRGSSNQEIHGTQ